MELTQEQRDGISYALELAIDDQKHYLSYGDLITDYAGDDDAIASKRKAFLQMKAAADLIGELRTAQLCDALVLQIDELVEYGSSNDSDDDDESPSWASPHTRRVNGIYDGCCADPSHIHNS